MSPKIILITGSTDGIGRSAASQLVAHGHQVLLHGRTRTKLDAAASELGEDTETHLADLSNLDEVDAFADRVLEQHERIDVLINNAGVFKTPTPRTSAGLDVRFVVNTLAPYRLTRRLLPIIPPSGRVVNLSSAAQAPVQLDALRGEAEVDAMAAYAQSKLAITLWSRALATELRDGPSIIAVNPGSYLATKMVKEGFDVSGRDIGIGAEILLRAALDDAFASASGKYFDNDAGAFAAPHPAAHDPGHSDEVMRCIEQLIAAHHAKPARIS